MDRGAIAGAAGVFMAQVDKTVTSTFVPYLKEIRLKIVRAS